MFHLLLCVTESIKQSHAVRGGWFWIEFQPGQGNLDHTDGDRLRSRPRYSSPFFSVRGSGAPSPTTEPDVSTPVRRDKNINPTSTKRVQRSFHSLVQSGTEWNEPHIATLSIFDYTSGISQLHNPARCPYISAGIKVSEISIYSREVENPSTSTVPN